MYIFSRCVFSLNINGWSVLLNTIPFIRIHIHVHVVFHSAILPRHLSNCAWWEGVVLQSCRSIYLGKKRNIGRTKNVYLQFFFLTVFEKLTNSAPSQIAVLITFMRPLPGPWLKVSINVHIMVFIGRLLLHALFSFLNVCFHHHHSNLCFALLCPLCLLSFFTAKECFPFSNLFSDLLKFTVLEFCCVCFNIVNIELSNYICWN